ncbi:MAG: YeeE/YedE family protein [Leptolyngbyaceae bacterium]|nr:YeeE/YedE family protein [Leptolyngbyaceae bacterium]
MNTYSGIKENGVALLSGLIFGIGLGLSQMIDRDRVLGFLDVAGTWDPTLLFVLGGAVGVTVITFRFVLRMPHPLLSKNFYLPTKKSIDVPLIVGAAIFGIGWGIAGYCPGPALTALTLGISNPVLFIIALIAGSLSYTYLETLRQKRIAKG